MSKVKLHTVLFYQGDEAHRPRDKELQLEGVEKLFRGMQFPRKGMTFLYGHRNAAITYLMEHASMIGMDAAVVDVHVEIGQWLRHKVDLSEEEDRGVKFTRLLSIPRAKKQITDLLEAFWVRHLGPERAAQDNWPRQGTQYPQIFDEVIADPLFKHLAVIAYTIKTAEAGDVQVATVFDEDAIELVDGGFRLADTELLL